MKKIFAHTVSIVIIIMAICIFALIMSGYWTKEENVQMTWSSDQVYLYSPNDCAVEITATVQWQKGQQTFCTERTLMRYLRADSEETLQPNNFTDITEGVIFTDVSVKPVKEFKPFAVIIITLGVYVLLTIIALFIAIFVRLIKKERKKKETDSSI